MMNIILFINYITKGSDFDDVRLFFIEKGAAKSEELAMNYWRGRGMLDNQKHCCILLDNIINILISTWMHRCELQSSKLAASCV